MLTGLAIQPVAAVLRPWIGPIIVLNILIALLRLDIREVLAFLRRPGLAALCLGLTIFATPLVMWSVLEVVPLPEGTRAGLILMAAAPPIMSAPAFALILGLDAAYAVFVVIVAHLIVPFTLPVLALWLVGLELELSAFDLMLRLLVVVGSAFVLAFVLKATVLRPEFVARNYRRFDALAVIGLLLFSIAVMDGITPILLERTGFFVITVVAAFAANIGLQVAAALMFLGFGRRLAFTTGHMTGNRNMGLVLASMGLAAPPDVAAFFALAQLPMYMLPSVTLPLYRRLLAARPAAQSSSTRRAS